MVSRRSNQGPMGCNFSNRFPQIVAALIVLSVRSSQRRRLFCRFSDQTPALKCVMTDDIHRTCPHCGGKNASYFIGIDEAVWFTTKYETFLLAATLTGTSAPTGRDACFTVRDKNGQALAYVSPIPS
jgi:hypothetical protein